jgi:hypothetical protein
MVSQAISEGNMQAVNYLVAEKYVGALKAMATSNNQKVIFLPIEAASLAGSVGGIAELTRSVFGGGDGATAVKKAAVPSSGLPRA